MHFIVTFAAGIYSQLSKFMYETQIFNFGHRPVYIYDSKTVKSNSYFSRPKRSASKNVWETLTYTLQKTRCAPITK
jgi:hypothetical protein